MVRAAMAFITLESASMRLESLIIVMESCWVTRLNDRAMVLSTRRCKLLGRSWVDWNKILQQLGMNKVGTLLCLDMESQSY